jgi:hypothetical protein
MERVFVQANILASEISFTINLPKVTQLTIFLTSSFFISKHRFIHTGEKTVQQNLWHIHTQRENKIVFVSI